MTEISYQDRKELPTLYKKDSNGKERLWRVWVVDNMIHRMHGIVDGKMVESDRTFEGKSIGKKNETTPEEQAWAEANKYWVKQLDKEYLPKKKDEKGQKMLKEVTKTQKETGGHNINAVAANGGRSKKVVKRNKSSTNMVDGVDKVIPMKAQVWELKDEGDPYSVLPKISKYFGEPFYAQPKLDGWRARITRHNNEIVISSNSGKQYPWFTSLRSMVKEWFDCVEDEDLLDGLDGELYAEKLYEKDGTYIEEEKRFQTISSINGLSRSKPHEIEDQMQFHCFDLMDVSGELTQKQRFKHLKRLFKKLPEKCSQHIIKVETVKLDDVSEVPDFHDKIAKLGYEGVVLRSSDMTYMVVKRNIRMRKYKNFIDAEYKVVKAVVDKGVEKHYFSWVCVTDNGEKFRATPMGTHEEKLDMYENRGDYYGRLLTVKFQEYSEDGVPRFPIAKYFRESGDI